MNERMEKHLADAKATKGSWEIIDLLDSDAVPQSLQPYPPDSGMCSVNRKELEALRDLKAQFDARVTHSDDEFEVALDAHVKHVGDELKALREAKAELLLICQEASHVLEMMDALGDFPKNQLWLIQKLNKAIIKHGGKP